MEVRSTRSRPEKVAVEASGGDSRQRILESAAGLFRSQGYAATALRAIAAASDMQAGSLYHHFAGKEQIVSEVLDIGVQRVFDAVKSAVQALPADAGLAATLQCAIEAHLRALLQSHDFTSANIRIFGQVPAHVRTTHGALRRRYERFWRDMLSRLQQRGEIAPEVDLQRTTFYLFGAMNWATEWYDERRLGIDALAAELAGLATHGLRPALAPAARRKTRSK